MSNLVTTVFRQTFHLRNYIQLARGAHHVREGLHFPTKSAPSAFRSGCFFSTSSKDSTGSNSSGPKDVRERARQRIAELEAQQAQSPNSPLGILDRSPGMDPNASSAASTPTESGALDETPNVFAPFPNSTNPLTGEVQGPTGPEPTRFGDWERKGRCSDF